MKRTARASLTDVAIAVGDALRRAGIRAVLTGGACATLYSRGRYTSSDTDFVLGAPCAQEALDVAMASVGFRRMADRYVHPKLPFFVEFPKGPPGIGEDFRIRPVWKSRGAARTLALSATDSCRDRLAAFYCWNDRQALAAAVAIASRNRVALRKIREWSRAEGHLEKYASFLADRRRSRRLPRAGHE